MKRDIRVKEKAWNLSDKLHRKAEQIEKENIRARKTLKANTNYGVMNMRHVALESKGKDYNMTDKLQGKIEQMKSKSGKQEN